MSNWIKVLGLATICLGVIVHVAFADNGVCGYTVFKDLDTGQYLIDEGAISCDETNECAPGVTCDAQWSMEGGFLSVACVCPGNADCALQFQYLAPDPIVCVQENCENPCDEETTPTPISGLGKVICLCP